MSKKVAVVTGANKGLGLAIVKGICEKYKGTVYLTSRNEYRGRIACEELKNLGLSPVYHQLDVTNDESIQKFISSLRDKREEVYILINNAGILFLKDAKESRIEQAEQTMFVNFFSLVNFTEAMLPLIKDGGRIVNITSSSGHLCRIPCKELRKKISSIDLSLGELKDLIASYVDAVKKNDDLNDSWGDSSYVVSKVGVNAYTFMLQRKLTGRGVVVNCVHPGYVMSDMTRGAGSVTPAQAAEVPLRMALRPYGGGLYVWHDGSIVPWDGPDPRVYIDGRQ